MPEIAIALLGMRRLGASMGLALKRHNQKNAQHKFKITAYDSDSARAKLAQKMGAADEVALQPENAVRGKDIVVLATPYGETRSTYDYIAAALRPGAVVLDTSPLNQTALAWGKKSLPQEVHQICIRPIINPKYLYEGLDETERATDDYFDKGTILLMPSVTCVPEAVELAGDFARILGARAHYVDPAEHDGLSAATDVLPSLLGVAYFYQMMRNAGWIDSQRLTNPAFGMLTHPLFDTHPDDLRDIWLHSGDDVVRAVDELMLTLRNFRMLLAQKDQAAVEAVLDVASKEYEAWVNRRYNDRWTDDEKLESKAPGLGDVMGGMFGGFLARRGKKDDE